MDSSRHVWTSDRFEVIQLRLKFVSAAGCEESLLLDHDFLQRIKKTERPRLAQSTSQPDAFILSSNRRFVNYFMNRRGSVCLLVGQNPEAEVV